MRKHSIWISFFIFLTSCSHMPNNSAPVAWQSEKTTHQVSGEDMNHKSDFFVARKGIADGYVIIFHIMPAPLGEGYSRSNYHLMVSVEKDKQPLANLTISSRIKHPDGTTEENTDMKKIGDWYISLHNFNHELGQHWITISFEQDGKKYSSGIYYPERAYHQ